MLDLPSHCLQTEGGGVVLIRVCVFSGISICSPKSTFELLVDTNRPFPCISRFDFTAPPRESALRSRRLSSWASRCCSRSAWRPPCSSAASARCGWTPMRSTRSAWPTQVRAIPLARCETLSRSAAPAHQWHASVCLVALRFCDERRQKPVRCLWAPCGRRGESRCGRSVADQQGCRWATPQYGCRLSLSLPELGRRQCARSRVRKQRQHVRIGNTSTGTSTSISTTAAAVAARLRARQDVLSSALIPSSAPRSSPARPLVLLPQGKTSAS